MGARSMHEDLILAPVVIKLGEVFIIGFCISRQAFIELIVILGDFQGWIHLSNLA